MECWQRAGYSRHHTSPITFHASRITHHPSRPSTPALHHSIHEERSSVRQHRLPRTKEEARVLMRARRHLAPNDEDNFGILASDSLMGLWQNLTGTLASGMVGLVSIFLVIGGVVIMNVMLASVTERTREIGIRKSLGAKKRDILMQFLVESTVMTVVGGALGVLIAWILSVIVRSTTRSEER